MQLVIESTERVVTIVDKSGAEVQARVWQGQTDSGIPVVCLICRVAVPEGQPQGEFQRELVEHQPPSADALQAFPLRFVI